MKISFETQAKDPTLSNSRQGGPPRFLSELHKRRSMYWFSQADLRRIRNETYVLEARLLYLTRDIPRATRAIRIAVEFTHSF